MQDSQKITQRKGWKYDANRAVWSYASEHGNCEITIAPDGNHDLEIKVAGNTFRSCFPEMLDAMRFCEQYLKYPNGRKLGIWGKTWRFGLLAILLGLLIMYPFWWIVIYCGLSYAIMGIALCTGGFSTGDKFSDFIMWLGSPLVFLFLLVFFGLRLPIL